MGKAFFLDRDGVINRDKDYVYQKENFEFIEGVFDACKLIQKAGYKIIIITNQSGIGRGYYSEDDFHVLNQWMLSQFLNNGVKILDVYYCPHHPSEAFGKYKKICECRKPKPGMIIQAAIEHQLDLSQSVLVGDRLSDIQAANTAKISHSFLVSVGPVQIEKVHGAAINLLDAVNKFLSE